MFKNPKASIVCEIYENRMGITSVSGSVNDLIDMLIKVIECAAEKKPSFVPIALSCINEHFSEKGKNKTS